MIGLEPGQPDYRVLIVEDQEENWLLLERLLQTVGFQVRVANDGRQGVEMFQMWRPHFIWMDIRLPVLSGSEAATRIRQLDGGEEVKIVAVTASAFTSQRDEVLKAGFDDFLRKPYRSQEVFDCMARHLGVRYRYGAGQTAAAGDLADFTSNGGPRDASCQPSARIAERRNCLKLRANRAGGRANLRAERRTRECAGETGRSTCIHSDSPGARKAVTGPDRSRPRRLYHRTHLQPIYFLVGGWDNRTCDAVNGF